MTPFLVGSMKFVKNLEQRFTVVTSISRLGSLETLKMASGRFMLYEASPNMAQAVGTFGLESIPKPRISLFPCMVFTWNNGLQ